MTHRLLCIGDVHIGCSPSRVPAQSSVFTDHTPRAALQQCAHLARQHQVDAVVLSGDICDSRGAYLESLAAVSTFVAELSKDSIPAICVAGNHDAEVLPRIVSQCDNLHLLGKAEAWGSFILQSEGKADLQFLGRSFRGRFETENPFRNFENTRTELPTVGVLHCDFAEASQYFPVSQNDFSASQVRTWVLGHIHKPHVVHENPYILYPGSLQGLDPSEQGKHGVTLLEIEAGVVVRSEFLPVASLRYEQIDVQLTDAREEDDIQHALLSAARAWLENHIAELTPVRQVVFRARFTGAIQSSPAYSRFLLKHSDSGLTEESISFVIDDIHFSLEKVSDATRHALSLARIAEQSDPAGLLAKKLLELETGSDSSQSRAEFISHARDSITPELPAHLFSVLNENSQLESEDLQSRMQEIGAEILAQLLIQKDARS